MPRQIEKGSIEWQHKNGHFGMSSPQPHMSGAIVGQGGLTQNAVITSGGQIQNQQPAATFSGSEHNTQGKKGNYPVG